MLHHQGDKEAIDKVSSQGYRLSILGIGTNAGGPIPLQGSADGGFLQDSNGAIVIAQLHAAKLQSYALSASGLYTGLQADDSDANKLSHLFESSEVTQDVNNKDMNADVWQEEGHWLLLPLLFFAALWARKGWIAVFLPFVMTSIFAIPPPAYAEPVETLSNKTQPGHLDMKHLWSSPDQKAMKAFKDGDNENAASLFTRAEWKASAYYRNGDYESAVKALENTSNSNGYYNKANALAKLGQYQQAIKAYDSALALNENNEDAHYNREQVKQALQQQQQKSKQENSEQEKDQQEQESQDGENPDNEDKDSADQSKENQDSEDQQQQNDQAGEQSSEENKQTEASKDNQEQQDEEQQDEKQQAEEKQLKQRDAEAEAKKEQQEKQQYEQDKKQTEDKNNQSQQETENNEIENKQGQEKPAEIEVNPVEASITEEEKATEQWLKRIPDDPGGLLRRKFLYQYKQIPNQNDDNQPW